MSEAASRPRLYLDTNVFIEMFVPLTREALERLLERLA
jgi:hypothetical protein